MLCCRFEEFTGSWGGGNMSGGRELELDILVLCKDTSNCCENDKSIHAPYNTPISTYQDT